MQIRRPVLTSGKPRIGVSRQAVNTRYPGGDEKVRHRTSRLPTQPGQTMQPRQPTQGIQQPPQRRQFRQRMNQRMRPPGRHPAPGSQPGQQMQQSQQPQQPQQMQQPQQTQQRQLKPVQNPRSRRPDFVLYFRRSCRNSLQLLNLLDQRPLTQVYQQDIDFLTSLPSWLTGTPALVDTKLGLVYKGTDAKVFIEKLCRLKIESMRIAPKAPLVDTLDAPPVMDNAPSLGQFSMPSTADVEEKGGQKTRMPKLKATDIEKYRQSRAQAEKAASSKINPSGSRSSQVPVSQPGKPAAPSGHTRA